MQNVKIKYYPNPPVVEQNITFELRGTISKSTHAHEHLYNTRTALHHTAHTHTHTHKTHTQIHTQNM